MKSFNEFINGTAIINSPDDYNERGTEEIWNRISYAGANRVFKLNNVPESIYEEWVGEYNIYRTQPDNKVYNASYTHSYNSISQELEINVLEQGKSL